MYVKLQKIERHLNMKNTKSVNKNIVKFSWFIVLGGCFLAFMWIVLFNTVFMRRTCLPLVMLISTGIGLLTEIAEVYFVIHLVISRVNYLNHVLRQEMLDVNDPRKKGNEGSVYFVMKSYDNQNSSLTSEVVTATYSILDALSDFTELFQFSLFYFVCQILAWNLVSIHSLITSLKEQRAVDYDLMLYVMPLLFNKQFIMLTLCLKAQSLSTKLEESRKLCIDIVSSCFNDCKSRDYAKQIILLVEGRRSLSIYNIFTLGTRLPLHLLAVTASYTIVLLQFALL
ncbi:hypothetical protein HF086_011665 [Spodoptera exigua]|uniref:Gustatory receptor n=1 Tax=Spodoptera exigua TaxID=7107 RepID=A0A922SL85_SPOEX|nr:hypothetical protein HF086_011665 [Spodoptera exigua]